MEHGTGELVFRVVLPEWIDESSDAVNHYYVERFKRSLMDNMRFGMPYFTWLGEVYWYRQDSGREFYYEMPNRFYDDSEVLVEIKALLLLTDWSVCEVGEACIGRPEWNLLMFGLSANVQGPDEKNWTFQREHNSTGAHYAEIWRRVR
jgi:hypothetical protein